MTRKPQIRRLELPGLEIAPAQAFGNVRLVPLLRRNIPGDLRLGRRSYREDTAVVSLGGELGAPGVQYSSFVPHGFVVSWSDDGAPVAAFGTSLFPRGATDGKAHGGVRLLHRMAKREGDERLRLLPLHLALEGFLGLHFGGPDIAWAEYSRRAIRFGLSPRREWAVQGAAIPGLGEALRVFEIHDAQVGVLVCVADALASAFVVPHPDDFRALFPSLLDDLYGELLFQYGLLYHGVSHAASTIDARAVASLADLRAALAGVRREWADFGALLAAGALGAEVRVEEVYRMSPFRLERFIGDLELGRENHLGEAILRDDGTVEYLKTYRLSDAQVRRAYLLKQLAARGFHLDDTAAALRVSRDDLIRRLVNAGFEYLLKPHVIEAAMARRSGNPASTLL